MKTYYDGVAKLRKHNINVCCTSLMAYLWQNYNMMMATAKEVAQMDVQGIDTHYFICLKVHRW